MKNQNIVRAYDHIQPEDSVYNRVLAQVNHRLSAERQARRQLRLRRIVLAAACIALFIALSTITIATYEQWHLPQPSTYTSPDGGNLDIHREETYHYTGETTPDEPEANDTQAWTDQQFIEAAVAILELAGLEDVDTSELKVRRQSNLYYDREEAEVFFLNGEILTTVRFHAQTGSLISLSSVDYTTTGEAVCQTEAEAEALAKDYYSRLPVPQTYVLTGYEVYDEQYWSYSFCREVMEGLFSYYEMVRISINPVSGRLTGCNVFHIPLLDDHSPEDVPLTQEEAEAMAQSLSKVNLQNRILESATVEVVHPNYFFTEQSSPNLESCAVTRLGWRLVYTNPNSTFADEITILIDLYTGELLGGDMT